MRNQYELISFLNDKTLFKEYSDQLVKDYREFLNDFSFSLERNENFRREREIFKDSLTNNPTLHAETVCYFVTSEGIRAAFVESVGEFDPMGDFKEVIEIRKLKEDGVDNNVLRNILSENENITKLLELVEVAIHQRCIIAFFEMAGEIILNITASALMTYHPQAEKHSLQNIIKKLDCLPDQEYGDHFQELQAQIAYNYILPQFQRYYGEKFLRSTEETKVFDCPWPRIPAKVPGKEVIEKYFSQLWTVPAKDNQPVLSIEEGHQFLAQTFDCYPEPKQQEYFRGDARKGDLQNFFYDFWDKYHAGKMEAIGFIECWARFFHCLNEKTSESISRNWQAYRSKYYVYSNEMLN
jgi:hypothetical protein